MRRNDNDLTELESNLLIYAKDHINGFHGWQYCLDNPFVKNPTVYRTLARLEKRNYLRSVVQPSLKQGMPAKRLYVLTFGGQSAQVTSSVLPQNRITKTMARQDTRKAQASNHSV